MHESVYYDNLRIDLVPEYAQSELEKFWKYPFRRDITRHQMLGRRQAGGFVSGYFPLDFFWKYL
jgi:hypothetical protein